MSEHKIHLIGSDDDEIASLKAEERDDRCHIAFSYQGRVIEASASDFFEGFCQIRSQLEQERLIPFCYGASLNVFPSGMARDMGAGLSAYRLAMGRAASSGDLVSIFDSGPDVIPSLVSTQEEFFNAWIQSLEQ